MSAAILQGVPATTLDTDIWIDLPERSYMRVLNLSRNLGATVLAKTAIALADESLVNFLYRVDGLNTFDWEYRRGVKVRWMSEEVVVLPLARIIKSKEAIRRPKDLAHLPLLNQTLKLKKKLRQR